MLKKIFYIIGGIIAFFAIIFFVVMLATQGVVKAADEMFIVLKNQDMQTASSYFSQTIEEETVKNFIANAHQLKVVREYKESSWSNRIINGKAAELRGSITSEKGGVRPVHLKMVKENGAWKIYYINIE